MAIFQCNSVTLREYDKLRGKELGSGVFPTIARINHSCVPNTVLSYNLETKECEVIFILIDCLIVMIVVFNFLPIHNEKCSTALTIHRRTNLKIQNCVCVCLYDILKVTKVHCHFVLGTSKQRYQGRRGDIHGIC